MSGTDYAPKTELGKAMLEARKRIIAMGEPLKPAKELMADLAASRRGDGFDWIGAEE